MAFQPLFIRGWKQLSAYRLMFTTYMNDITIVTVYFSILFTKK